MLCSVSKNATSFSVNPQKSHPPKSLHLPHSSTRRGEGLHSQAAGSTEDAQMCCPHRPRCPRDATSVEVGETVIFGGYFIRPRPHSSDPRRCQSLLVPCLVARSHRHVAPAPLLMLLVSCRTLEARPPPYKIKYAHGFLPQLLHLN